MKPECAICYVTDINYLLPTLASCHRVRQFIDKETADVCVFLVNTEDVLLGPISEQLTDIGIQLIRVPDRSFDALRLLNLSATRTNIATFGRLLVDELLPSACKRIVYLDADIWPVKDISPLIAAIVPDGYIAAAEDVIFYRQRLGVGATTRSIRAYFSGLGLDADSGYFNAGVLVSSRVAWRELAAEAHRYAVSNPEKCKNFDQSALNAVARGRRLRLSTRWNFQTQFKLWGAEERVDPSILHFNRNPKPWCGPIYPWENMLKVYEAAMAPFSSLNLKVGNISEHEVAKRNAATRKSYAYLQWPLVGPSALLATRFYELERSAWM